MLSLNMHDLAMLDADMVGVEAYGDAMVAAFRAAESPVPGAIANGNRDEDQLTDLEFFARHPERGGAKLQTSETALVKEWLSIRDDIVRPALVKARSPAAAAPAAPANRPSGGGSTPVRYNEAAAFTPAPTRETAASQRNTWIALGLATLAFVGIGIAATRR